MKLAKPLVFRTRATTHSRASDNGPSEFNAVWRSDHVGAHVSYLARNGTLGMVLMSRSKGAARDSPLWPLGGCF